MNKKKFYLMLIGLFTLGTIAAMLLFENIAERKAEAKATVLKVVDVTEDTIDPAEWGKNYPRQYDSYKRTVDIARTKHGGSEAFQKLDEDPLWREFFKGYSFSVDYREERGHAYMLSDQTETERIQKYPHPGSCLHCHSSVIPAYRKVGQANGVSDGTDFDHSAVMKGFEEVNKLPYHEARELVDHPVSCVDCHDPKSMHLRVTRPGFLNGIQVLAKSSYELPQFPSVERWRKGDRKLPYNPNTEASWQEMRSMVCTQCHVEYYFKGEGKYLTYPWHNGLKMDQIEEYYNAEKFKDWIHATTKAPMLKAQHPEFELWSQGIHARSGVSCADCHMPYKREGAMKISDHHVRSPVLNLNNACQTCHNFSTDELKARVENIQDKTRALMDKTEVALMDYIEAFKKAETNGASEQKLAAAREFHRKAQWRLDFIAAENSMGFHAPQEAARILAEAIDYARQGEIELKSK